VEVSIYESLPRFAPTDYAIGARGGHVWASRCTSAGKCANAIAGSSLHINTVGAKGVSGVYALHFQDGSVEKSAFDAIWVTPEPQLLCGSLAYAHASALRGALDGGRLCQHLALPAAARVVRVGEFEQFDGRAVFDYERDADAVGWAVRRNQDFAASKLGVEISHFKRDVRKVPDEIRDRCVRFETHPLHAEFAFLVADDKDFQVFQVGLPGLRFGSGNSDVMVPAHCFLLSVELAQILRYGYRV